MLYVLCILKMAKLLWCNKIRLLVKYSKKHPKEVSISFFRVFFVMDSDVLSLQTYGMHKKGKLLENGAVGTEHG